MRKKYKALLGGCFYSFFADGVMSLMLGAVMPMILSDYKFGYDTGGMLLSLHSLGNLIASFATGIVAYYIGRKNSVIMLPALAVLGVLGIITTKSVIVFMISFLLIGLGRGSIGNSGNNIVNDISTGKSGPMNLLHMFFAVGAFMAPFIASWCISSGLGWKFAIGVPMLLFISAITLFLSIKFDKGKESKKESSKYKGFEFIKIPDFYVPCTLLFFYIGVEYSVNGWIVTYLKDTGIMSISIAQSMLSILWIVIIFGRLFCAYISKFVDKGSILLVSSAGVMTSFIFLIISSNITNVIICMVSLGFFLSGIYPTTVADAGNVVRGSGLALGTLMGIAGLGGTIMPYLIGIVAKNVGMKGGMMVVTAAMVLMFLCSMVNKLRKRQDGVQI